MLINCSTHIIVSLIVQAKQSKDYMRPFFRMTKNRTLPKDMLSLSSEIVDHCRAL